MVSGTYVAFGVRRLAFVLSMFGSCVEAIVSSYLIPVAIKIKKTRDQNERNRNAARLESTKVDVPVVVPDRRIELASKTQRQYSRWYCSL
jgi:hypothetical protein